MTWMEAWEWIFSEWGCREWKPIPSGVKQVLHLHPLLGVCGGQLVTRAGARGMEEFINRINRR